MVRIHFVSAWLRRDRHWPGQSLFNWVVRDAPDVILRRTVWMPDFVLHLLKLRDVALIIGEYKPEPETSTQKKQRAGTSHDSLLSSSAATAVEPAHAGASESKGADGDGVCGTPAEGDGQGSTRGSGGYRGLHANELHDRQVPSVARRNGCPVFMCVCVCVFFWGGEAIPCASHEHMVAM
jgi:hypothetical protein